MSTKVNRKLKQINIFLAISAIFSIVAILLLKTDLVTIKVDEIYRVVAIISVIALAKLSFDMVKEVLLNAASLSNSQVSDTMEVEFSKEALINMAQIKKSIEERDNVDAILEDERLKLINTLKSLELNQKQILSKYSNNNEIQIDNVKLVYLLNKGFDEVDGNQDGNIFMVEEESGAYRLIKE